MMVIFVNVVPFTDKAARDNRHTILRLPVAHYEVNWVELAQLN